MKDYLDAVLGNELFSEYSAESLASLLSPGNHKIGHYEKGQIVHIEDEVCLAMDIVIYGALSVQKIDEDGNVLRVAVFSGGDILGANLLFSDRNVYPLTIVAEAKTVILHLSKELVFVLSRKSSSFTAGLLAVVSNKTLVLTGKINALSLKTVRQRIVDFLRYQYHIQQSGVIRLDMSKKDLAERFGIQRTSLSRELNKMRRDGLIDFDSKTITIEDPRRLGL